jgi:hypothetical protein
VDGDGHGTRFPCPAHRKCGEDPKCGSYQNTWQRYCKPSQRITIDKQAPRNRGGTIENGQRYKGKDSLLDKCMLPCPKDWHWGRFFMGNGPRNMDRRRKYKTQRFASNSSPVYGLKPQGTNSEKWIAKSGSLSTYFSADKVEKGAGCGVYNGGTMDPTTGRMANPTKGGNRKMTNVVYDLNTVNGGWAKTNGTGLLLFDTNPKWSRKGEDTLKGTRTITGCSGTQMYLNCQKGGITILKAFYGRHKNAEVCAPLDSRAVCEGKKENDVRANAFLKACNGRKSCSLPVLSTTTGVLKGCNVDNRDLYLQVEYKCSAATTTKKKKKLPIVQTMPKPHTESSIVVGFNPKTDQHFYPPRRMSPGTKTFTIACPRGFDEGFRGCAPAPVVSGAQGMQSHGPCVMFKDGTISHRCFAAGDHKHTKLPPDGIKITKCTRTAGPNERCANVLDGRMDTVTRMLKGGSITIQYPVPVTWNAVYIERPATAQNGLATEKHNVWTFAVECMQGGKWKEIFDSRKLSNHKACAHKGWFNRYGEKHCQFKKMFSLSPGSKHFPLDVAKTATCDGETWRISKLAPAFKSSKKGKRGKGKAVRLMDSVEEEGWDRPYLTVADIHVSKTAKQKDPRLLDTDFPRVGNQVMRVKKTKTFCNPLPERPPPKTMECAIWEITIAPKTKVTVSQACRALLPYSGGEIQRLPCTAIMDGDVNSPVVFKVPRKANYAKPAFVYSPPGTKPTTYKAMWLYLHPAHDDALHKRLHTFEVQCETKPGTWKTVLKATKPKGRRHRTNGSQVAHDGCAGGKCKAWVQYKFDNTKCSSQKWRITKMNGEEPGKQIYIFEMHFATHLGSMRQCALHESLGYTPASPCLPRRKPARVQGYCIFNQPIQLDGAEHCFNDNPKGYPKWLNTGLSRKEPLNSAAARNSIACLKNDITKADWSGKRGSSSIPITEAVVAETYTEEVVFPWVKTPASPGRGGADGFWFRLNTDKGELFSGRQPITSTMCAKTAIRDQRDYKSAEKLVTNYSPYPNTCRYMEAVGSTTRCTNCTPKGQRLPGYVTKTCINPTPQNLCPAFKCGCAWPKFGRNYPECPCKYPTILPKKKCDPRRFHGWGKGQAPCFTTKGGHVNFPRHSCCSRWNEWPNAGKEFQAPCCPFRHLYTAVQPVDAQQLRGSTVLDFQIGESFGTTKDRHKRPTGYRIGMYSACLAAQGRFVTTFWYKTTDPKAECTARMP